MGLIHIHMDKHRGKTVRAGEIELTPEARIISLNLTGGKSNITQWARPVSIEVRENGKPGHSLPVRDRTRLLQLLMLTPVISAGLLIKIIALKTRRPSDG